MESNSKVNRIHCSSDAAELLRIQCPELPLKSRGLVNIKGKGEMHTFWVNEEDGIKKKRSVALSRNQRRLMEWTKEQNGGSHVEEEHDDSDDDGVKIASIPEQHVMGNARDIESLA